MRRSTGDGGARAFRRAAAQKARAFRPAAAAEGEAAGKPAGRLPLEVSVVVVNWNARDRLARCLASVFRHTRGVRFEVMAVDNASEDGSPAMVERDFPRAGLIRNRTNAGFAAACNAGIRAGRGEKILLLNSDTEVCDNAVGEMAAFLERHTGAAIAGCRLVNEDGSYQKSWGRDRSVVNEAREKLVRFGPRTGLPLFARLEESATRRSAAVDWVSGAFLMIRKSVVERIGLMDDRFFLYFEDIEWCARAREAGWTVLYNPAVSVVHAGGGSTSQAASRCSLEYRRSQLLFYRIRHGDGVNLKILRVYLTLRALAGMAQVRAAWRLGGRQGRGSGDAGPDPHRDLLKLVLEH